MKISACRCKYVALEGQVLLHIDPNLAGVQTATEDLCSSNRGRGRRPFSVRGTGEVVRPIGEKACELCRAIEGVGLVPAYGGKGNEQ